MDNMVELSNEELTMVAGFNSWDILGGLLLGLQQQRLTQHSQRLLRGSPELVVESQQV
ncbi:hypothetical protein [Alicyclobacillus tolerans]|uniref:Uncharacterized protein n=1 Tax=Alicyclobacillus tolerans TaxID=90970 RepID=A0A1M6VW19_9BACL|nr:hypothetical protein [Alicyclobacillus montanus]SHK85619.1 hypothetical protein SAMN05443507_12450 [Alicyclobacillus montanus]